MPIFNKTNNKSKNKEYAIIGLSRFGGSLARRLESLGHPVLGIDVDPHATKEISNVITEAIILDATDEDALRQADITAFQTVIVSISSNFEANALTTSTLKKLGIPNVISISNSDRHREILLRIGADKVILPDEESGHQLADELSIPGMLDRLHLTQEYSLIEIKPPPGLVGKGVEACEPFEVIVVLVLRGNELILNPDPTYKINGDDILVLVGEKGRLAEFGNL